MPINFEINKYAFLYGDYEYFQWFIKKTKENLKNVIKWKGLRRGKPNIDAIWSEEKQDLDENAIRNLKFGIVTRAFLFHLKWPLEYPIFDSNVFKAMMELNGLKKKANITNVRDYEHYRIFFKECYTKYKSEISNMNLSNLQGVDQEIIRRRVLDRALWELGKIYKKKKKSTDGCI